MPLDAWTDLLEPGTEGEIGFPYSEKHAIESAFSCA